MQSSLITSSLGKKYLMALSGLFLCLFLVGHLLGNLQLFVSGQQGADNFNLYAKFMTTNPIVKVLSYLTYFSIIFHMVDGLILTIQNRRARPKKYVIEKGKANSSWASRNMALLGTILLVFIATHMQNFWYVMHFGEISHYEIKGQNVKDLHHVVMSFFTPTSNSYAAFMVGFYVLSMLALAYHLHHGFVSAFQSLGLNHIKYNKIIEIVGAGFSIVVPLLFASIPLYVFINHYL
tara:strand:+ start:17684 stop:18388 length:705 start_codon:yes stop_codon:yes gene_type:complete